MFINIEINKLLKAVFKNQAILIKESIISAYTEIQLPELEKKYFLSSEIINHIIVNLNQYLFEEYNIDIDIKNTDWDLTAIVQLIVEIATEFYLKYEKDLYKNKLFGVYLEYATLLFVISCSENNLILDYFLPPGEILNNDFIDLFEAETEIDETGIDISYDALEQIIERKNIISNN